MSIPTPQFASEVMTNNRFSMVWMDFIQRVYQAIGILSYIKTIVINTPFTLILPGETVTRDRSE